MIRALIILALLLPQSLWAAPRQVTLFPASAQVEDVATLTVDAKTDAQSCVLTIPGQADPGTLHFGALPAPSSITDVSWTGRQEKNQTALAPLDARLKELTAARDGVAAELEGVRGRLAFWKAQTKPAELSVATLRELAAEMHAAIRQDTAHARKLEHDETELDAEIARVKESIERIVGQERTVWDVRLRFAGQVPKELSYAYTMTDCGWSPVYRLDARPAEKRIDFSWQAKVWQRSGQDWTGARILLATMQPDGQTTPPDLPQWEIGPMEPVLRKVVAAPAMMEMNADTLSAAPAPAPRETRRATYAVWDLGQQSLPAGETRTLEIEHKIWSATFTHLIRPGLGPKAFVQAETRFEQAREFPAGTGIFLVDGAMLDQRPFSFSGREGTFFFGANPLLRCETVLLDKKTDEKGLFSQKRSFAWDWTLTVHNAADYPANVRVEEPRPQIRDERITLSLSTEPKALDDPDPALLAWNATVPGGKESVFRIRIAVEAPDELHIDPGWRW